MCGWNLNPNYSIPIAYIVVFALADGFTQTQLVRLVKELPPKGAIAVIGIQNVISALRPGAPLIENGDGGKHMSYCSRSKQCDATIAMMI